MLDLTLAIQRTSLAFAMGTKRSSPSGSVSASSKAMISAYGTNRGIEPGHFGALRMPAGSVDATRVRARMLANMQLKSLPAVVRSRQPVTWPASAIQAPERPHRLTGG